MKVLYRISEGGNSKDKLNFVYDKKKMFLHFIKIFAEDDIYVFADNVSDEFYSFLTENYNTNKIMRIALGNSKSFMYIYEKAINEFDDNETVYFAEDDYIYKIGANKIIEEGLQVGEYSSGYDHLDKYISHNKGGPNPFIQNGGENTRVMITQNIHWKITNSCCMTFASKVKTLKEDYDVFAKYCKNKDPQDFQIFCELKKRNHNVVSCIPGVSTHGETKWLSPFVNWTEEYDKSI
jgi:hypothetical protein